MNESQVNNSETNFEKMHDRLEEVVRTLESGEASLENSIKLFEEASELVKRCRKVLDNAQLRITELQDALSDDKTPQPSGQQEQDGGGTLL